MLGERERDTERERERKRDGRKWRHHCRAKIGDEFTLSRAKNSHELLWVHTFPCQKKNLAEAQWPIGYGVGLRIKRSSVRIRPWPLRWVLGQGSLLPLSQGEAFTLASISYLAILVKYILAKKKKKNHTFHFVSFRFVYSVPTTTSPNICPVDGVVHRNIGSDFLYIFFVSL